MAVVFFVPVRKLKKDGGSFLHACEEGYKGWWSVGGVLNRD